MSVRFVFSTYFCWCDFSHNSLLLVVFGQRIWRNLLRQLLIKVCNILVVVLVVIHVSAPYSSTDFTLELNRRIFMCNDNILELQMFLSYINAPLALPILALTSTSVPPCLSIILPRYVKISTIYLEDFVLHLCIFNPTCKEMAASSLVFSCIC